MKSERGQGVMELTLIAIVIIVAGLLFLACFGKQVEAMVNQVKWSLQGNNVTQTSAAEELYAELDAEDQAYLDSMEGPGFGDLPFSQHALDGHPGQWNAVKIAEAFDSGKCIPQKFECAAKNYDVWWCEIHPGTGYEIALLIGRTFKQVITGYMVDHNRWSAQSGTCQ